MTTTSRPAPGLRPRDAEDAPGSRGRRVLVVSAGMGGGHHGVADELVRRLSERGHTAERVDVLDLGRPGQGRRLRRTYAFLLRRLPWVYDLAMRSWARWPAPLQALTAHGARAYETGLLREVRRLHPDVVVSVYNLAGQALGRLRASGRLPVPVVTYVTDPGPHPYWVHPAVDLHLAVLEPTARALESYGASRAVVVPRVVPPPAGAPTPDRAEARARWGLPARARIALVSGGSWAAARVERTAVALAASGAAVPVTLCGRDDALRQRLTRLGAGVALGWTDDVASVMAAADVLVDDAGGLTCAEALACGLPVILHAPLPGHGRLNAEALEAAGEAAYARREADLISLVRATGRRPSPDPERAPVSSVPAALDAVTAILRLAATDGAR